MGLFDFFRHTDINAGAEKCVSTQGAVLLDVRTASEYAAGHIDCSRNIPLQSIESAGKTFSDKNTPLFVYCHSGARSRTAVRILRNLGYSDVTDLGGIINYKGKVVR